MGGRRRRRMRGYRGRRSRPNWVRMRSRGGWGMNLYRNPRAGVLAGVCAGLAEHWEVERWVVRLVAVALLLFTGSLAFWGYIVGWILLSPRRDRADLAGRDGEAFAERVDLEYDELLHAYRPRKMFQYGASAGERLRRAGKRLDAATRRVEEMESYVTSRQYRLNREFSRL